MDKQYKHWLKIPWQGGDKEHEEIKKYMQKYPNAKIELWVSETDVFSKYFSLICSQEYDSLDMNVNTSSNVLRRLERKPANLLISKMSANDYLDMVMEIGGQPKC